MQFVNCTVQLNNDPRFTVRRYDVSLAEVILLRAIHGDGAVSDYQDAGVRKGHQDPVSEEFVEYTASYEVERLRRIYGLKDEVVATIDKLYPGHSPVLPDTFEAAGIDVDDVKAAPKRVEVEGKAIVPPGKRATA